MVIKRNRFIHFIPYLITGLSCLLLGFIGGYRYYRDDLNKLMYVAKSEEKVINGIQPAIEALNSQYDSCIDAYRVLSSCVSDGTKCNLEDARNELTRLESHRK